MPVYNPAIPVAPVEYEGVTSQIGPYQIGLASNALLYPGLGLGTIVVGASKVTAGMLLAAAEAVRARSTSARPAHRWCRRCRICAHSGQGQHNQGARFPMHLRAQVWGVAADSCC